MFHPKVLIIYFLIFVLCISLAISYALIMLFEVFCLCFEIIELLDLS